MTQNVLCDLSIPDDESDPKNRLQLQLMAVKKVGRRPKLRRRSLNPIERKKGLRGRFDAFFAILFSIFCWLKKALADQTFLPLQYRDIRPSGGLFKQHKKFNGNCI